MAEIIVVGVDGSETAQKAADAAARLAAATGATLHVVTAYDKDVVEELGAGGDRFVFSTSSDAEAVARSTAARYADTVADVTSAAGLGKPAEVLLKEAALLKASVIVVGNRRMQGAGRLLGSIANDVAHHAPCDVYVVKTVD